MRGKMIASIVGGSATCAVEAAARSVSPHLRALRWCGFCRSAPGAPARAHSLYRAVVLAITCLYLLQECVYAYQERADMDKLARVMFLLLCHVTSIVKQLVFHLDADRIDTLISCLHEPELNERSAGALRLLAATRRRAAWLQRVYAGGAVLTCTLWLVFPAAQFASHAHVEFPFWIGMDYSGSLTFAAVMVYTYYVTTLVGIANTTMDAFMATVLYQCKTQLVILRMNFESLTERAQDLHKTSRRNYESVLMKLLVKCLFHYRKICEITHLLMDIFGLAILVQFGVGGWILCMAAYKLVSMNVLSVEFASMCLFIVCILTELFLYCYFGNEVTVESGRLVGAVYECGWVRAPRVFQRSLVLVMERARRPLRPAAGRVVPLSLDTFLKILKSSYTFYAVLRQTKAETP